MQPRLRVHVIFVGAEPADIARALAGAKLQKPDRIYLLTMRKDDKYATLYQAAKEQILRENIVASGELKEEKADYYDILDIMKTAAKIIRDEKKQGNEVFFSLASGGKLLSGAITLACTIFEAEVYYVRLAYPDKKVYSREPIIKFPTYHVAR
ncbi:MAG: DUF6293 family protein, partial [Candidatus Sigynarchaeota archaeon]